MSCGQLPWTIKTGITKVAAHEEIRALEVIPVRVSFCTKKSSFLRSLTELDPGDPLSVIV